MYILIDKVQKIKKLTMKLIIYKAKHPQILL